MRSIDISLLHSRATTMSEGTEPRTEPTYQPPLPPYNGTYYRVGVAPATPRYGIIGGILAIDGIHYGLTSILPFLHHRPPQPPVFGCRAMYSVETNEFIGAPPADQANQDDLDPRFWSREQGWALVKVGPKPEHWINYWYHDMSPDKVVTPRWPVSRRRGDAGGLLMGLFWDFWCQPVPFRVTGYRELRTPLIGPVDAYQMKMTIPYYDLIGAWVVDPASEALVAMIVDGPHSSEDPRHVYAVDATVILDELARRFPGAKITIPNRFE